MKELNGKSTNSIVGSMLRALKDAVEKNRGDLQKALTGASSNIARNVEAIDKAASDELEKQAESADSEKPQDSGKALATLKKILTQVQEAANAAKTTLATGYKSVLGKSVGKNDGGSGFAAKEKKSHKDEVASDHRKGTSKVAKLTDVSDKEENSAVGTLVDRRIKLPSIVVREAIEKAKKEISNNGDASAKARLHQMRGKAGKGSILAYMIEETIRALEKNRGDIKNALDRETKLGTIEADTETNVVAIVDAATEELKSAKETADRNKGFEDAKKNAQVLLKEIVNKFAKKL